MLFGNPHQIFLGECLVRIVGLLGATVSISCCNSRSVGYSVQNSQFVRNRIASNLRPTKTQLK